jgi:hypothetical protein
LAKSAVAAANLVARSADARASSVDDDQPAVGERKCASA